MLWRCGVSPELRSQTSKVKVEGALSFAVLLLLEATARRWHRPLCDFPSPPLSNAPGALWFYSASQRYLTPKTEHFWKHFSCFHCASLLKVLEGCIKQTWVIGNYKLLYTQQKILFAEYLKMRSQPLYFWSFTVNFYKTLGFVHSGYGTT